MNALEIIVSVAMAVLVLAWAADEMSNWRR
jgi:hypothetical protein